MFLLPGTRSFYLDDAPERCRGLVYAHNATNFFYLDVGRGLEQEAIIAQYIFSFGNFFKKLRKYVDMKIYSTQFCLEFSRRRWYTRCLCWKKFNMQEP